MPQPFDYRIRQPDVADYFSAFTAGRKERLGEEQDVRNTALAKYLPQALQGDQAAREQALGSASPDQQIALTSHFAQMDNQTLARTKEQQAQVSAAAVAATTPEAWAQVNALAKSLNPQAPDIPFEAREQTIARSMTTAEMLDQEAKKRGLALDERQFSETQRHNRATEAAAMGGGADAYPPETLRAMAKQYLAGDKSVLQNLGRGKSGERAVRDLRNMIQSVATEMRMTPQQIASKLAEYSGYQSGFVRLGARQANIDTAAREAYNFADLAVKASQGVPRGQFVPLTQAQQLVQRGTSDPALKRFVVQARNLANAAAVLAGRGETNQYLQEEYANMLATADSQEAFEAAAKAVMEEADAASKSTRDVRDEMVGGFTGNQSPASAAPAAIPKTGEVRKGYKFLGGDPADPKRWRKAAQ